MKKTMRILKNILAVCLSILILSLTTACNKKHDFVNTNTEESVTPLEINNGEKVPWWAIVIGSVIVIINVTEGQYYKIVTQNPDGSTTIEEGCKGLGHCHMAAHQKGTNNQLGVALSSSQPDDGYDFSSQAELVKTSNGKVLLKMHKSQDNEDSLNRFFYNSQISVSLPLIIDNPAVLQQLGENCQCPITIEGVYDVFDTEDCKFIILR